MIGDSIGYATLDNNIIMKVVYDYNFYNICIYSYAITRAHHEIFDFYFPQPTDEIGNFLSLLKRSLLYILPEESLKYIKINNLLRTGGQIEFKINKNGCLDNIYNSGICL